MKTTAPPYRKGTTRLKQANAHPKKSVLYPQTTKQTLYRKVQYTVLGRTTYYYKFHAKGGTSFVSCHEVGNDQVLYDLGGYAAGTDQHWRKHMHEAHSSKAEYDAAERAALGVLESAETCPTGYKRALYRAGSGQIIRIDPDGGQTEVEVSGPRYHSQGSIRRWSAAFPNLHRPIEVGGSSPYKDATAAEFREAYRIGLKMCRTPFRSTGRPNYTTVHHRGKVGS